jgi:phosphoribosylformylglycinamidine cyclo-ligase
MAKQSKGMTYAQAGVDIEAGDKMVDMIRRHMKRTFDPRVIDRHGGYAGFMRLDYGKEKLLSRNYKAPVLVACTDGVGTKVKLAAELKIYDTVGIDLVAMSVNDLIVSGAEPLLFLDYLAVNRLSPEMGAEIVKGVADGCVEAGCALLGGETAEMPDVYADGDFDMAGFAVGVINERRILDGSLVKAGDVVIGIASSGIHSNGYSLVRAIVKEKKLDLRKVYPELDKKRPLGEVLLTPTKIYAKQVSRILKHYRKKIAVTAMAHITGSGIPGNLPRVFSEKLDAELKDGSWEIPPVFRFLQAQGEVDDAEMRNVFNMGLGYMLIVRPKYVDSVMKQLKRMKEKAWVVGKMVKGTGQVRFV